MAGVDGTGPHFTIGDGYACYEGAVTAGSVHRHAAFQVAVGVRGEAGADDAAGTRHRGAALIVPPMAAHRLLPARALRVFFVEPHCAFADRLRPLCGDGVTPAPGLGGLREEDVRAAGARPSGELDGRLLAAMRALADGPVPLAALAADVGLSPQRLRALARAELGMPLARWRVWRRLAAAADAMRAGRPLGDAALAGGFADQAHFTREMRRMMGITPAEVARMLRASAAARGVDGDGAVDR
ncbi:helix-turn-helix domain-containing protein [Actinomadura parmotrematis]|uniref:AraC family transcriptional regulator n=1 Tax=Actinomadura parmotrematis TaxID=2864039 RepID=A0ABS7G4Q5_9ACTN|nr:AraC family transcriptional regulator [Actinomadura parmotrematis]MBW8487360.1 AraC family transcriptional regulator [Actinomadura parmotrematis]